MKEVTQDQVDRMAANLDSELEQIRSNAVMEYLQNRELMEVQRQATFDHLRLKVLQLQVEVQHLQERIDSTETSEEISD